MENSKMKIRTVIFFIVSASLFLSGCNDSQPNQQQQGLVKPHVIPLSHTYCDNLDTALAYPDEVTYLSIRGLDIDSLPINFMQMTRLKTVFIGACEKLNFAVLFKNMSKNNTIKELEISECNIGKLQPEIGEISSLKNLLLRHNNLTEIPSEIANLVNLEGLFLFNNKLNSFPVLKKDGLKNIKEIEFSLNHFTEVPESVCDLVSLESLMFDDNKIEKITNNISKLSHLKKLGIGNNPISERAAKRIKMERNYGEEMEKIMKLIPQCKVNIYRAPAV